MLSAVDTTSVSSAAISDPMPVRATTQRVVVRMLVFAFMQVEIRRAPGIHRLTQLRTPAYVFASRRPHDDPTMNHDHDRGLSFDMPKLISRRRALGLMAGGVTTAALAACGSSDTTRPATTRTTDGTARSRTRPAGPYPGDGSNGPNALTESGIVRSDITTSFGDASGVAEGVPTAIEMTLLDVAAGGAPLAGAAVYVWHCDIDGRYSMYDEGVAGENYLRGVQESDGNGKVAFASIFPAAYAGRWPHIHFEVYESLAAATVGRLEAQDLAARPAPGRLRARLRHRGVRAERGAPRRDLARRRHGLQRRLRQPARDHVGHGRRRHDGQAERRRVSRAHTNGSRTVRDPDP